MVLYLQHTGGERFASVGGEHRHGSLHDNRAGIHFGADEMDRRAMHANTCRKCAFVCVEAWEKGEQGRVDVKHPIAPCLNELTRKDPHEAGEADDLDSDEA